MAQTAAKLAHKHHGDFIRRSRGEKIADGVLLAFMILLLCFFLGGFGAHRFYVGKIGTAIAQLLLTIIGVVLSIILVGYFLVAAVGIWVLVDLIMIIIGSFTDKNGLPVKP